MSQYIFHISQECLACRLLSRTEKTKDLNVLTPIFRYPLPRGAGPGMLIPVWGATSSYAVEQAHSAHCGGNKLRLLVGILDYKAGFNFLLFFCFFLSHLGF